MGRYKQGDVVLATVIFSDKEGYKARPVIILNEPSPGTYLVVECSTLKTKHNRQKGFTIRSTHKEFITLGFQEDTFINIGAKSLLLEKYFKRPIGSCTFINDID